MREHHQVVQQEPLPPIGPVCENATCQTGKPAVLEVEGMYQAPNGERIPIRLKICQDCAAPILAATRRHVSCSVAR